jgi:GDPmannose 4,6-dehydratase
VTTAFVTGIAGQDGSYLAEWLIERDYRVVGLVRRSDRALLRRITHLLDRVELVEGDLRDERVLRQAIEAFRPREIYNLAARASSRHLAENPIATAEHNGLAVLRLLEVIRSTDNGIRFCQASSSEIFGNAARAPQRESTPFAPRNAYGIAKLFAHCFTADYRETKGIFACSAILYNHESPRRGDEFVTRRITRGVAMIKLGRQANLTLGSMDAARDWGYAPDYVRGLWLMLQAEAPQDYVLATGESHTVRDFCRIAFEHVGLDYRDFVRADATAARAIEPVPLVGDAGRARRTLGWKPTVSFDSLVRMMVDADLSELQQTVD